MVRAESKRFIESPPFARHTPCVKMHGEYASAASLDSSRKDSPRGGDPGRAYPVTQPLPRGWTPSSVLATPVHCLDVPSSAVRP